MRTIVEQLSTWAPVTIGVLVALHAMWRTRIGANSLPHHAPNINPTPTYHPPQPIPPAAANQFSENGRVHSNRELAWKLTVIDLIRREYIKNQHNLDRLQTNPHTDRTQLTQYEQIVLTTIERGTPHSNTIPQHMKRDLDYLNSKMNEGRIRNKVLNRYLDNWDKNVHEWTTTTLQTNLLSEKSQQLIQKWEHRHRLYFNAIIAAAFASGFISTIYQLPYGFFYMIPLAFWHQIQANTVRTQLHAWHQNAIPHIHSWNTFKKTLSDPQLIRVAPREFFNQWDHHLLQAAAFGVEEEYIEGIQLAVRERTDIRSEEILQRASWLGVTDLAEVKTEFRRMMITAGRFGGV